jgi:hypothetical protein
MIYKLSHLISKLESLKFLGKFIPKNNQNLLYGFLVYFFFCSCGYVKLEINWIVGIVLCHLLMVVLEYVHCLPRENFRIDISLAPTLGISVIVPNEGSPSNVPMQPPEMHVDASEIDLALLENIKSGFMEFTAKNGIEYPKAGVSKDKVQLTGAVEAMINNNPFLSEVKELRKVQDYFITKECSDAIVSDMTEPMRKSCDVQSFNSFKSEISETVHRGFLCASVVYGDGVRILNFTQDFFVVVIFALKIKREEKGWIIRSPVLTGKYCSFLFHVSTSDFLDFRRSM